MIVRFARALGLIGWWPTSTFDWVLAVGGLVAGALYIGGMFLAVAMLLTELTR